MSETTPKLPSEPFLERLQRLFLSKRLACTQCENGMWTQDESSRVYGYCLLLHRPVWNPEATAVITDCIKFEPRRVAESQDA